MDFQKIISTLKNSGIITHPTDTCYGLACDPFNEEALERLYKLKEMPRDKPVTWMVGSLGEAEKWGEFSDKAEEMAAEGWPGALTLVVPRRDREGTIGLRVPADDFSLRMLREWGGPLTTTSANLSGEGEPYSAEEALAGGYVVDMGEIPRNKPSRVVKVVGDEVEVLRD